MKKDWLDNDGCFLFGKHKGRFAGEVALDDPNYLRWVLEEVEDCSDEDREILSSLLPD